MLKAYEYRIYPTPQQETIFNQTLGLCRLYWNTVVFNKNQDHNFQIEGYKQIFLKYKPCKQLLFLDNEVNLLYYYSSCVICRSLSERCVTVGKKAETLWLQQPYQNPQLQHIRCLLCKRGKGAEGVYRLYRRAV